MSDLVGQTIDQFQILESIDQRGRASVFKGFQPKMNRYVAVKILSPELATDRAIGQRFQEQAERAAGLEHRNILPTYDYGQYESRPYVITRYVDTGTLADRPHWVKPRREEDLLGLIGSVAAALDYAHGQGVVHGNLKPANIFVDQEGQPLVSNFGSEERELATPSPYRSLEQVQGRAVDQQADVYALGAILYEMVVGEPPPAGRAPSPRSHRPELPEAVEMVILKAMAAYPEQRYQTAGQLSQALEQALQSEAPTPVAEPQPLAAEESATAQPAPQPTVVVQQNGRNSNWVVVLVGALVVLALVAAIVLAVYYMSSGQSGTEAPAAPAATEAPQEPVPTEPPAEQPPQDESGSQPAPEEPGGGEAGEPGSGPLSGLCGSAGFAPAFLLGGVVLSVRRRWPSKRKTRGTVHWQG